MRNLKEAIKNFIISGFFAGSIVTAVICIFYTGSVIFGYHPYFRSENFLLNRKFANGIPVSLSINNIIQDSAISIYRVPGSISDIATNLPEEYKDTVFNNPDTTAAHMARSPFAGYDNLVKNKNIFRAGEQLEFKGMIIHVQPRNFKERVVFMFPHILLGSLISYCLWQLATFLQFIRIGYSFDQSNHKRLKNIGLVLIVYNLLLVLFDLYFSTFTVMINLTPGIKDSPPFYLLGTPDLVYGYLFFYAGCIFIILSSAFKKGSQLQQEQDLTF